MAGDNYLLPQQTTRFLLRALAQMRVALAGAKPTSGGGSGGGRSSSSGQGLSPALAHLLSHLISPQPHCTADSVGEMATLPVLVAAFDHRAARLLVALEAQLKAAKGQGLAEHDGEVSLRGSI